jgi:pimeloyl-ACP methyl ester carboxylesterase
MERRGRPGSGPQRADHSIDDECADLVAVAEATGSSKVFGHSFGGLVALETARQTTLFDEVILYEPGVPIDGQLHAPWLDGYQDLLARGDRRTAFAYMVKHAGFAPRMLRITPLWCVELVLRVGVRGNKWATIDRLLACSLIEHRIQESLDSSTPGRFSTVKAKVILVGGARSPAGISAKLLSQLAPVLDDSSTVILPRVGHDAPEQHPGRLAQIILTLCTPSTPQPPEPGGSQG